MLEDRLGRHHSHSRCRGRVRGASVKEKNALVDPGFGKIYRQISGFAVVHGRSRLPNSIGSSVTRIFFVRLFLVSTQ